MTIQIPSPDINGLPLFGWANSQARHRRSLPRVAVNVRNRFGLTDSAALVVAEAAGLLKGGAE